MSGKDRQAREAMHGAKYVRQFANKRQTARVVRLLERISLPLDADILDIGCGTGILGELLAGHYASYTGVDFSLSMVQAASMRAEACGLRHCHFLHGDAVDVMCDRAGAWDAIFMLDISEHVPDREWITIVQTAHHALKPGGRVYLHTPNLDFALERMKQHGLIRQFPEHIAVRDIRENMGFFSDAGYTSVSCSTVPHYNVLRWLHPLSHLPIVGKYMAARLWIIATK